MKNLEWKLLASALFLSIVFDLLFYETNGIGLNVLLMQIAILAVSLGLARYQKLIIPKGAWIAASFSLLYALTIVIWTSAIGIGLSIFGLLGSNLIFAAYLLGHHGRFHHPIHAATDTVRYGFESLFTRMKILGRLKIKSVSRKNSSIFRGTLIALPIVLIFLSLFLGSDLVLQQRAEGVTNWMDEFLRSGDIIAHLFIIGFFTLIFLILFATAFWQRLNIADARQLSVKYNIESAIVLASVNMLFLAFIAFQAVYFFGGQSAWEKIEGITYSEYAVQGFNELATVAVLVILLILSLRYFHTEKTHRKIIHILELTLIGQTLLIVFSAWKRMTLYVDQYGFTPARLFGFWFFILCAVILLLLAYHIAKRIPQYKFLQQAAIATGAAMLIFTVSAPDALSVRLNTARNEIEESDAFPLFHDLSAEAYPSMQSAIAKIDRKNTSSPGDFCDLLDVTYTRRVITRVELNSKNSWYGQHIWRFEKKWNDRAENGSDWRSWNLSRSNAHVIAASTDLKLNIVPFSVEEVSHACGVRLGDTEPVEIEDRRE